METTNVQGQWMDELNTHMIKCKSANSQEELKQAAEEFERFHKEWKGDQDPKFQAKIRGVIAQNSSWLREWKTRSEEQKRLLDALEASNKMERYLNKASRKRLLSEVKAFLNRNPLPPGSEGMRDLMENAKHHADRWRFQLDFKGDLPTSIKKSSFAVTAAISGLTGLIGLFVGIGLFLGAFHIGLFNQTETSPIEIPATEASVTQVLATEPPSTNVPAEISVTPVSTDLGLNYFSQDKRLAAQDALLDETNNRILFDSVTQKPYYIFVAILPEEITVIPDMNIVKAGASAYVLLNGAAEPEKTIELIAHGEAGWGLKITDPEVLQSNAMNKLELVFMDSQDQLVSDQMYIFWMQTIEAVVETPNGVTIRDPAGSQNGSVVLLDGSKVQVKAWTKVEGNQAHPVWYQLVDGGWITATFTALELGSPLVDGSALTLPRFETDMKRNIPYLDAILPYIP